MKKLSKAFGLLFVLVLITGCGGEKLTCIYENIKDDGVTKQAVNVTFKDGIVNVISITTQYIFNDTSEIDEEYESMKNTLEEYKNLELSTSSNLKGNTITLSYAIDYNKISDEALEELGSAPKAMKNATKDYAKGKLKELDFICE